MRGRAWSVLLLIAALPAQALEAGDCTCTAARLVVDAEAPTLSKTRVRIQTTSGETRQVWLLARENILYLADATPPPIDMARDRLQRTNFIKWRTDWSVSVRLTEPPLVSLGEGLSEAPAGQYRMRVVYSLARRPWRRGSICVATSDAFTVTSPTQFRYIR